MRTEDVLEAKQLQDQTLVVDYPQVWYDEILDGGYGGIVKVGFVAMLAIPKPQRKPPKIQNGDSGGQPETKRESCSRTTPPFHLNNSEQDVVSAKRSRLIGCATLRIDEDRTAGLMTITVRSPYRGQGVGRTLLEYITNYLTRLSAESAKILVLQVHEKNKRAIQFYKNLGFRITGILKDYYCTGPVSDYGHGVQMSLSLGDEKPSETDLSDALKTINPTCLQTKAQRRNNKRAVKRAARSAQASTTSPA
ncbi:hypothetical protein CYMTET_13594 [Cymbomonas tetramitiformis]|uniref:N-acetyltransferase domain-containing protein n=1 Tax=Cymbomonas tetramitiformis TaxID=36881 RepID=A0AAE0GHS9_9CHLO|nr:hypothetical protein CYMTET_13594 [Cymbomonas tetramitiformis]